MNMRMGDRLILHLKNWPLNKASNTQREEVESEINKIIKSQGMIKFADQVSDLEPSDWEDNYADIFTEQMCNIMVEALIFRPVTIPSATEVKANINKLEKIFPILNEIQSIYREIYPWSLWRKIGVDTNKPIDNLMKSKDFLLEVTKDLNKMYQYSFKNYEFNNEQLIKYVKSMYVLLESNELNYSVKITPLDDEIDLLDIKTKKEFLVTKASSLKIIANSTIALGIRRIPLKTVRDYLTK